MELLRLRDLKDTFNLVNTHYENQKTVFSKLFACADSLNTADGQRLYPGFAVESHVENDYFNVRFVGRCFRFSVQLYWNPKQGPITKLSCSEIISTELDIKPKSIYEIYIDQYGVTNDLPAGSPDAYRADCTDRNDVLRLILQGVFMGLADTL